MKAGDRVVVQSALHVRTSERYKPRLGTVERVFAKWVRVKLDGVSWALAQDFPMEEVSLASTTALAGNVVRSATQDTLPLEEDA